MSSLCEFQKFRFTQTFRLIRVVNVFTYDKQNIANTYNIVNVTVLNNKCLVKPRNVGIK
jgi:hypothetical protein